MSENWKTFFSSLVRQKELRARRANAVKGVLELEGRGKGRGEPLPLREFRGFRGQDASKRLTQGSADYYYY